MGQTGQPLHYQDRLELCLTGSQSQAPFCHCTAISAAEGIEACPMLSPFLLCPTAAQATHQLPPCSICSEGLIGSIC